MIRSLASLMLVALLAGCTNGTVGGPAELCQQAAAHLAQCTGKKPQRAVTSCDPARAEEILDSSCDGRSSQSWFDDLCNFGFVDCSGLGNAGLGSGFTDPTMTGASCGTVTEAGSCSGDTLSYCDFGQLFTFQCDPGTCAMQAQGYYDCGAMGGTSPTQPTQPNAAGCGTVTEGGSCNGNIVTYCDFGQLVTYDCGTMTCQVGTDGWADCS